jgi:hypothetical protein
LRGPCSATRARFPRLTTCANVYPAMRWNGVKRFFAPFGAPLTRSAGRGAGPNLGPR